MEEEICKCGHARDMHKTPLRYEDGQAPPKIEKDVACKATNCPCEEYTSK